jgi:hypothetical protein
VTATPNKLSSSRQACTTGKSAGSSEGLSSPTHCHSIDSTADGGGGDGDRVREGSSKINRFANVRSCSMFSAQIGGSLGEPTTPAQWPGSSSTSAPMRPSSMPRGTERVKSTGVGLGESLPAAEDDGGGGEGPRGELSGDVLPRTMRT